MIRINETLSFGQRSTLPVTGFSDAWFAREACFSERRKRALFGGGIRFPKGYRGPLDGVLAG